MKFVQESHLYRTDIEIWAGFGWFWLVEVLKKIIWVIKYATFEGSFLCFHGQKNNQNIL